MAKYKQGVFKPKNPAKYTGKGDIIYRSSWERHAFKWCDTNTAVKRWSSEDVVVPYFWDVDKRWHRYFCDLLIEFEDKTLLIEIKPDKETKKPEFKGRKTKRYITEATTFIKNQQKWEAASKYASKRGWEFVVWTEHTLNAMGIMKASRKRLKPLSKPKRKRK